MSKLETKHAILRAFGDAAREIQAFPRPNHHANVAETFALLGREAFGTRRKAVNARWYALATLTAFGL